jgi:hypothetical protein
MANLAIPDSVEYTEPSLTGRISPIVTCVTLIEEWKHDIRDRPKSILLVQPTNASLPFF